MSKLHVYIATKNDVGGYNDFQEVTKDVISLSDLNQQLDQSEYDIGIFRNSDVTIRLENSSGKYSNIEESPNSIFRQQRLNSKVRVTWQPGNDPLICGFFVSGAQQSILSEEITVYEGLLNDKATKTEIESQDVRFKILGYDSILDEITVPFSILGSETFSSLITKMLQQSELTDLIEIEDIDVGLDVSIDDLSSLENKTVRNVLRQVLFASNSILYIDSQNQLFVKPRQANETPNPSFMFYGEASTLGIENITDISNYRNGFNRVFNYWTWSDTTLLAQDSTSTQRFGINQKQISNDLITDNNKRNSILQVNRDEFSFPRREFEIKSYLTPDILVPTLNDRISVDYPILGVEEAGQKTAVYGQPDGYDVDYYATDVFSLQIQSAERWKILSRRISFKNDEITFLVREIIN